MITTDLALVGSSFIRLCLQCGHGRLCIEQNSTKKFSGYYGKNWLAQALKLDLGQFVYLNGGTLKVIDSNDWKPKTRPRNYFDYDFEPQPIKLGFWQRFLKWC
jgi:hypothetical protein